MWSKAERTLLNDANRARFTRSPPPFSNLADSPGPAAYHPPLGARTTHRYCFLKSARPDLIQEQVKASVPGPGSYAVSAGWAQGPPAAQGGTGKSERDRAAAAAAHEERAGVERGPASPLTPGGSPLHARAFTVGRQPRYCNMINGANSPTLKEYVEERHARPSPDQYEDTALQLRRRPQQPLVLKSGRQRGPDGCWRENLDGRRFSAIAKAPGPSSYSPPRGGRLPAAPCGGSMSRGTRDDSASRCSSPAAPPVGTYQHTARPREQAKLPMRIPGRAGDRPLERFSGNTDLKKQRSLPGPASYHPIYNDIVRRPYTM